ncbi:MULTISPECIES: hypothetical protein [Sphingobacterium]|uniref:GerMN domain-containing protein n=1 Tax=Sphingobacterium litopenaei TaxID=2763500 RepID=A0ABR7YEA4_9SPHI|nr:MULTISPECIES: hypothetical protein [Sphingobacterium]MBD1429553.1 hypothetical protein [Sphingobacterium litopenaei]NGM72730.1 hypothetical protein [Sphingobacterium sp. SGL-16]
MKRLFSPFVLFSLLTVINFNLSCVGDNTSSEEVQDSIADTPESKDRISNSILWTYDALGDSMVQKEAPASLSLKGVLDTLNTRYSTANLQLQKHSGDTLFVKIADVSYLQQLGSSGNYGFMAEIVYSLTEIPDVNYVYLDFQEVDHATPGLYSRKDFDNKISQ